MAEKKFLDLTGLGVYDTKIKGVIDSKDTKVLSDAKAYADGLATNYDPAGSAATAKQQAITHADGKDAAIAAAKSAADKAQGDVDTLKTYVGTIPPEAQVADVVSYVDKKTTGVASDAKLKELETKITTAESNIGTIQADYLKGADKTALQSSIDGVKADVTTLVGTDAAKSVRTIANEELAAQLIPETAKDNLNTLKEIADWIQKHPDDASAINTKIAALEGKAHTHANSTVLDGIDALKVTGWDDAVTKAHTHANSAVLDGITDIKVAAWDAAETNAAKAANTYTDGKIAEFVAITNEEINQLFAPVAV